MEENEQNHFEEFEDKKIERRKLLPLWIKIFCWIFMIFGVLSIVVLIFGAFGNAADISFYGFETNQPLSLMGLSIITVMALKGFAAYALWFEKDYAIKLGKIDALLGIVLCLISMFVVQFYEENVGIRMRLELILLIPYFRKLSKIQEQWQTGKVSV
jgi:glucan phosphoethanolaminetransferase (alkaline phosphatase superfamily)